MAPVLAYWDIRGLCESIRCLLHYTGTEFEDKRYPFGPAPDYDRSSWLPVKPTLGLDFPNLPYYIEGDLKLTQSIAILRHLGRKHGLAPGNTEAELSRADMAEQQASDLFWNLINLSYNDKFATEKESYIQSLQEKMDGFSKFLGTNTWLLGDKLTYVDFLFREALDTHKFLAPDFLDNFSNIKEYLQRFEALPNVEKYLKSEHFKKWPLYSPFALFGGTGDAPAQ